MVEENKKLVLDAFSSTDRPGIEDLCRFLSEQSDFFTAPASMRHHLAYPGGLAQHSLNVLKCAGAINVRYEYLYSSETIVIASLCHDLCKIGCYHITEELPTDPQRRYLASLMSKVGLAVPTKLNKVYAGALIEFMLKSYKNDGVIPPYMINYKYEDALPLGHGEKSLFILQQYVSLSAEEALAIRWHMGAFDLNQQSPYQNLAYQDAVKQHKLVSILQ